MWRFGCRHRRAHHRNATFVEFPSADAAAGYLRALFSELANDDDDDGPSAYNMMEVYLLGKGRHPLNQLLRPDFAALEPRGASVSDLLSRFEEKPGEQAPPPPFAAGGRLGRRVLALG